MEPSPLPTPSEIEAVHGRIRPYIHRTPLLTCSYLNDLLDINLVFKCENFQKVGAFKSRGAVNALFSLDDYKVRNGVCTHSSGNHAQALSRAALLRRVKAYIVMPETAPRIKVDAVEHYQGIITFCKPTLRAREETLKMVKEKYDAVEIHPYNDPGVILGQSTCAKEVYEDTDRHIDIIITPVGGGGLLSGTSLSTQLFSPDTIILAAEPEGASDAWRSFNSGTLVPSESPNTIADGLLTSLGSNTWPIIRKYVSDILLADDAFIIKAMKLIWERMKIIIEPSAALPLAALLKLKDEGKQEMFRKKTVAIILSGGNVDLHKLPWKSH